MPQLAEVQRQAFAEDVAQYGDGPPGFDSTDWQVTKLETSIYYKILYSKHIIGGIVVESKGNGHYVLNRLFVDPNFQSKGIGASAVGFIEKTISDARKWTLQTGQELSQPLLLRKNGLH